ncbi:MAG: GGDEF domain-containing protein [Lachnospiraceae bacterium]|nr:GGDEF domain-containing protein [Lachnospiraceae bacterium]
MCDDANTMEALREENQRLRRIIGALMHDYMTLCEANLLTKEVKVLWAVKSALSRTGLADKSLMWDKLVEQYIEHGVCYDDQPKVRRVLNRDFLRENLNCGENLKCEYRNELGVYGELRIFRIEEDSILAGFTEKNAEITERIDKIYSDSLTRVKNRKYYDEMLANKLCQAFVIADLDHFKEVNDTYGHACGDAALTAVAQALQASVRDGDDVVRYGGDEFLIIFRNIAKELLPGRMETIRSAVERIWLKEYPRVRITMSFGVVYGNEQAETMLTAADALLYESKQKRNSVTIRSFPRRSMKQSENIISLSDEMLDMVVGGVHTADTLPSEWAGYKVSPNKHLCPYCNHQTDGYPFTGECESEGIGAVLFWCHECAKPYAVVM